MFVSQDEEGTFRCQGKTHKFLTPTQKKKDNLDDFIENEFASIKKDDPGFADNVAFQQPAQSRPMEGQTTPSMPTQPKKVSGAKPFSFKPGQIKKANINVDSSNQSPDVSRSEPSQATMPKSIPTSMKKPAFMNKKPAGTKPSMMSGVPNMKGGIGGPQKVGVSKKRDFDLDEEIESMMPDSMKARDTSMNQGSAAPVQPLEQKKPMAPPGMLGGAVKNKQLGPKMMQNKDFASNSRLEKKPPVPVKKEESEGSGEDYDEDGFDDDKDDAPADDWRKKLAKENKKVEAYK